MKTKYERMNKEEKKKLIEKYKKEKSVFYKKMRNMFIICYIGIIYSIIVFIYDYYFKKPKVNYYIDIIIFVFSFIALLKIYSIRKNLLSDYAVKK